MTAKPMKQPETHKPAGDDDARAADVAYASHNVRLSLRLWLIVLALLWLLPMGWARVEPLGAGPDYRVPYPLSDDYWHVERWFDRAVGEDKVLVVGDSVVWGHYVAPEETLSHYLNELAGEERFANLGIDGIHPVAMAGLVEHYGGAIHDRDVILHCNLLWMSSPRADLQSEKAANVQHPRLVPQFTEHIPCYQEEFARRLGIVAERYIPFLRWANHVRTAYFKTPDVPRWSIEHPDENPLADDLELPSPAEPPSPLPVAKPWTEQGINVGGFDWVELDTSLQWRSFRRTVELLRSRGNRVFVVVGPFNEHMLDADNLPLYRDRVEQAKQWLEENDVPYYVPPPLPSHTYADASHPLADGYRLLAERLWADPALARFTSE